MRVVVVDDSLLFREGLVRLLDDLGFEVVGQLADADQVADFVADVVPDLVLVDIRMPPTFTTEGLAAAAQVAERTPGVGVVVLSQYVEPDYAVRLLEGSGAGRGYILKDRVADLDAFAESLRRVALGGSVVDPDVIAALVDSRRRAPEFESLSAREEEILTLMAEGLSNNGISERLVLSLRTTESHVRTIFQKLGLLETHDVNRRVLAVIAYLRSHG